MTKFYRIILRVLGVAFFLFGTLAFFVPWLLGGVLSYAAGVLLFLKAKSIDKQAPAKNEVQIPPTADPAPIAPAQNVKKYKVAGVTHYVDNILELAVEDPSYQMTKRELIEEDRVEEKVWKYFFAPEKVELVPEENNPQDPKAIKVVVDGRHVGYIKSGSCAHLRKVIEQGGIADIDCMIGGGPYKYVIAEEDEETGKVTYSIDEDETHIFVHLNITEKA